MDPQPVDVDENFHEAARVLIRKLQGANDIGRARQIKELRVTLSRSPGLLALLEHPDWQQSVRLAAVPVPSEQHEAVTPELGAKILSGDVLNVSYYRLPHKVVVESCSFDAPSRLLNVQAIHYGRLNLLTPVTVMREHFSLPCDGASVWLHKFPNSVTYTAEETLTRARSRLGEQLQNPIFNNAHSLALWCRVRDHQRNRDSLTVPMLGDDGRKLHQIRPADHVNVPIGSSELHAVVAAIESLGEASDNIFLKVVALTSDLQRLMNAGMCVFSKSQLLLTERRVERIQVQLEINNVRRNADRYNGTCLCWGCTDLQALLFLDTGNCNQSQFSRFTIDLSELQAGHVIFFNGTAQFVLAVHRPVRSDQTYTIDTVHYGPLSLENAMKTTELRLLISQRGPQSLKLVRHSEPDLQCPILLEWTFKDTPLLTETQLSNVADLQPGDAVCIREDTTAYPFASEMPGLHAIVQKVNESALSNSNSLEVICFTEVDGIQTVGVRQIAVVGHKFSSLVYQANPNMLATREETLRLATSRLGTGQYCCSWNNSRDLVRWCCVNHKRNSPNYHVQVCAMTDLVALLKLGQGRLYLEHLDPTSDRTQLRDVRLVSATHDSAQPVLNLEVQGVDWRPHCVKLVTIGGMAGVYRVTHVRYNDEGQCDAALNLQRSYTAAALLGTGLVNASDRRLGSGVSDCDFCQWLRKSAFTELPALLARPLLQQQSLPSVQGDDEPVADLRNLNSWDHVIVRRSKEAAPEHLLVIGFDTDTDILSGYTYGPVDLEPGKPLTMFTYFSGDSAPYPIHMVIERSTIGDDASSELSSSLCAAAHFPDDAAAWAHMAVAELESNLLLDHGPLNDALKSMLRFAFELAATGQHGNDGSLEAVQCVLASTGFARAVQVAVNGKAPETAKRLKFLVRLIASLVCTRLPLQD